MKPIFSVKTLTARHAQMMQDAIETVQQNAKTRTLASYTGADMLKAAREALRERNRYADIASPRIVVKADSEAVPNSYKYRAEGTGATLVLVKDDETGEEHWQFRAERGYARKVPHGANARTVAILTIPVGGAKDEQAARTARARLETRGWHANGSEMRKNF